MLAVYGRPESSVPAIDSQCVCVSVMVEKEILKQDCGILSFIQAAFLVFHLSSQLLPFQGLNPCFTLKAISRTITMYLN